MSNQRGHIFQLLGGQHAINNHSFSNKIEKTETVFIGTDLLGMIYMHNYEVGEKSHGADRRYARRITATQRADQTMAS